MDLSTDMLGQKFQMPVGIAPTGFTRMMQTEGELAGATSAQNFKIPFTLSTMGTRSIEEVCQIAPNGRNLFQLYMWKDRERSLELIERARLTQVHALVLTVDVPVAGARLREVRNGLTIPPTLSAKTLIRAAPKFR